MKKIIFFILISALICPVISAQEPDHSGTLFFYDDRYYYVKENNEALAVPNYFMELGDALSYGDALLKSYNKTKESAESRPADVTINQHYYSLTLNPSDKYLLRVASEQKYYIVEDPKILTEVNPSNYSNSKLAVIPDIYIGNYTNNYSQTITWDRSLYQYNFNNLNTEKSFDTIHISFSSDLDGACKIIYRQKYKDESKIVTCTKNQANYGVEINNLNPGTYYYLTVSCNTAGINIPIMYFINAVKTESEPTPSCNESWSCGEWTTCSNGTQTRSCNDSNSCDTTNSKPELNRSCETEQNNNNTINIETNVNSIEIKNKTIYPQLKGKIILKVESVGEAYYIHPSTQVMHYLGRPDDAFAIMREQGIGITNDNLDKIPVGLGNLTGSDSDDDGLPDLFEDAIGTNKNNTDSDGDGYNDKTELEGGYNPNNSGRLSLNNNFSNQQKGKIFLQVERNGEAWYINPVDGKRYFLGRPADAFQIMRNLGLGISNNDFDKL